MSDLTPAEIERLAMLAEECGEVIQIVGKILRFGYESYHPDEHGVTNRALLAQELTDVEAIVTMMYEEGDITEPRSCHSVKEAWQRKLSNSRHQDHLK